VFEPLVLTDMTLALLAVVAALALGRRARGPEPLRRRWLRVTAVLVAARLAVVGLVLPGGLVLVDARLLVQVPFAVLPVAWALWKPGAVAAHVAAAGVLLSAWWLFVPFGPQDAVAVLTGSAAVLAVVAGLSAGLARWRRSGSRAAGAPWLAAVLVLVPAIGLGIAGQANAAAPGHHHAAAGGIGVDQLTGPRDGVPDARLTLTASRSQVRLTSGRTIDALTFNGISPGPEIRVRQGGLVEVTLVNADVQEGVSLHWHGVDVPNAEDGVPGVTQDAVRPGGQHVYRFVPDRAGTFWYHTHRDAVSTVQRGLFGALVVEEPVGSDAAEPDGVDRTVFTHQWPDGAEVVAAFDRDDRPARQVLPAGRQVRLRMINSSAEPNRVRVGGTPFTVAAVDGNPLRGAAPVAPGTELLLAAGGRYDVTFTMPDGPVTLAGEAATALALSPDGTADPVEPEEAAPFDPLTYGSGAESVPAGFDRTFDLRLDDGFGFSQGALGYVSSLINGRLYPAVPTLEVTEGDEVKVRITNRSFIDHPMHLHGHRVRVLSRNGAPTAGTWSTDTLHVAPGEVYEIAFTADNPGIWMDHCHNFRHGANGMVMHLAYTGVHSPFSADHTPE